MIKRVFLILAISLSLTTCSVIQIHRIDSSISQYEDIAERVSLGDSKEEVLNVLLPTQSRLNQSERKGSEQSINDDGVLWSRYIICARRDSLMD
ncbi:hypothetical protein NONS58_19910 [Nitrosococcus oceani]|nr:hypothetical protein NONS58_19910 [Nitrosococcus oceani]